MPDIQWYTAMAAAMKARERCLNGIAKWQGLLAEAEAQIQALRDSDVADVTDVTSDPDKFRDVNVPADWDQQTPEPAPSI